ncbi:unnamed protein product [Porites evermanni]|uniref:Uncharacterized protein n=1 Tax=Porites evermanni TaxID=104178 RepID=A0ABN8QGT2_9CNID|nr:unnamed protein product [Porites evermanni]
MRLAGGENGGKARNCRVLRRVLARSPGSSSWLEFLARVLAGYIGILRKPPSDQTIFLRHTSRLDHESSRSDHHTRQSDQNLDQTTTSEYHKRPSSRPDRQIRSSDRITNDNPDYQIRSPHQTTGHHI